MSEVAQPVAKAAAEPRDFKRMALKTWIGLLGKLAPSVAANRATDIFGYTRTYNKKPPKDVTPLGARRFAIQGAAGVSHGYLWGEGEKTILLVHGWGADSSSMYSFVRSLQKQNYRVAAFDAPGHGVSEGTVSTMTAYKLAVIAAITSLGGVDGIIAHSLGGLSSIAALSELTLQPGMRETKSICLIAPPCTLPAVLSRWSKGFLQLNEVVMRGMYDELKRRNGVPVPYWDISQLGSKLSLPIQVFHDPQDNVVPFCEAEQIIAALPSSNLIQAPKTGHVRILSDVRVLDQVVQFLHQHIDA
jgi:omega-6 fatty acid desaturase (delta-12 desaturase)